jgi:hypothetical protein
VKFINEHLPVRDTAVQKTSACALLSPNRKFEIQFKKFITDSVKSVSPQENFCVYSFVDIDLESRYVPDIYL